MIKVGLTGGIGAGKTTVAKIFQILGVPVFNADDAAKKIMNESEALRQNIIEEFGAMAYLNGSVNRQYLANIVFNDTHKLEKLNALVHPAVVEAGEKWAGLQTSHYVVKEAALMFEAGSASNLDYVIGVFAPIETRIERVLNRDNSNRSDVELRMKSQIDENIKMKLCDFIILNDDIKLIVPQIINVHKKLHPNTIN